MDPVHVRSDGPGHFIVEVRGARTTTHDVTVPPELADAMGRPATADADVVRAAFAFLLEREPNTSILRSFSLDRIGDYFPQWRDEVARRLG